MWAPPTESLPPVGSPGIVAPDATTNNYAPQTGLGQYYSGGKGGAQQPFELGQAAIQPTAQQPTAPTDPNAVGPSGGTAGGGKGGGQQQQQSGKGGV
jgi:hypothetical protein